MSRIDEIQARADAAVPGPWTDEGEMWTRVEAPGQSMAVAYDVLSEGDRAFISHAREDVPWLVQRVRELEEGLVKYGADHLPTCNRKLTIEGIDLRTVTLETWPDTSCDCGLHALLAGEP
jgi:hypothetical protein